MDFRLVKRAGEDAIVSELLRHDATAATTLVGLTYSDVLLQARSNTPAQRNGVCNILR